MLLERIGIDIIRALPSKDMLRTFGKHRLEAEVIDLLADCVGIYQLGVPESGRLDSEMILDGLGVLFNLMFELGSRGQRSQGMVICLREEFHAPGIGQLPEAVYHLRFVPVELLEGGTRDGERYLEISLVLLNQVEKELVHREIAPPGYPLEDGPVREIVVVMRVLSNVKEPVKPEPGRLMHLEI